jgi:hypothetical protein
MVEHLYVVLLNRVLVDVVEVVYCILVAVVDMIVDILDDPLGVGADNTVAVAVADTFFLKKKKREKKETTKQKKTKVGLKNKYIQIMKKKKKKVYQNV